MQTDKNFLFQGHDGYAARGMLRPAGLSYIVFWMG